MSDRLLRRLALALAVAGIGVAGYLTWVHYADLEAVCVGGGGGCERVQSSEYAELAGIPVALLGLIGYLAITVALLIRGEVARMAAALFALAGAGFSLYLTYLELFEIDAICQWCVVSAVLMIALAVVTFLRLGRGDPDEVRGYLSG
jgi:uncharacterized membrane protein